MHILILRSRNPFYESNASGNRYAGIIRGLLDNNIKVSLVVTGGYNRLSEYKAKGLGLSNPDFSVIYTIDLLNNNIQFRRINQYVIGKLIKRINKIKLKKYLIHDFDYIWLTNNDDILSAFNIYYTKIHCNTIIELNEYNDIYKEDGAINNKLQQKSAILTENLLLQSIKKIDYFAVMTNTLIEHYRKMAKSNAKFFHFPMTVDLSRFDTINDAAQYGKPYIAYTGVLGNRKDGIDILIHSFFNISQKHPEYKLYLAGSYQYDVPEQKKLIAKYNLTDKIIYIGLLNTQQIPCFIKNADLLVLPRPDSHQARGGFPTKLGEYLATGNPVCVTKVGEIPDYLEDNISAFMAEPGDVDSFTNAMDRALSDKDNAKRVGQNGRKVAEENFSVDIQAQRLIKFLQDNLK